MASFSSHPIHRTAKGLRRLAGGLLLGAGVTLAAPPAQAQAFLDGWQGEVWWRMDLYADNPLFASDGLGTLDSGSSGTTDERIKENILPRAQIALDSRPADGTFTASAIDYPQGDFTDVIRSSNGDGVSGASVADFLGTDMPSFVAHVPVPADQPLSRSLWRFSGQLRLDPNTEYEFRVRSDDGNATWFGPDHNPDTNFLDSSSFRASGSFTAGDPDAFCCVVRRTTDDTGLLDVSMIFYERYGFTGLRMRYSTAESDFATFTTVGGDMMVRDSGVGVIPLPASAWLLLSGLVGLAALGRARLRARAA